MTFEQSILFGLVALIFAFLVWGRVRYDLVAFAALVVGVIVGVIPRHTAYTGFGHPAVVIVALVLVISRGLSRSGAIELLARKVIDSSRSLQAHICILGSVTAALSSLMNNVAALALLMPLDLQAAQRAKRSPAQTLMPLAFASILGGMVTLIGTPPNIVIATFREDLLGTPFGMFDFTPVGIVVAIAGVMYVVLIGWRLLPSERTRHEPARELEDLKGYTAEARVPESAAVIDQRLSELEPIAEEHEVQLLGIIRRGKRLPASARRELVAKHDLIVVEGGPDDINQFVGAAGLELAGADTKPGLKSDTAGLIEAAVPSGARIDGRSAMELRLLYRQGVTLLGISRKGRRIRERVRRTRVQAGDLLLLYGPEEQLPDVVDWLGCLPLAERGLEITQRHKAWLAAGLFAAAILAASVGLLYLPVALAAVVVAYVALRIVPLSQVYESVEWPVIVLLGSMIPLGVALEQSGGTALVARALVNATDGWPVVAILAVLMIVTMTLSDVLNNVATALIAAPIGVDMAQRLDANPGTFLMTVAVAASCAFLTPIGHKNNTIIMGPGGYQFGDYWRMGLPLEILVVAVGLPMILTVWPL